MTSFTCLFSERLMNDIAEEIFNYLDYESLKNSEVVSSQWHDNILYGKTWKKLLERNVSFLFSKFSRFSKPIVVRTKIYISAVYGI